MSELMTEELTAERAGETDGDIVSEHIDYLGEFEEELEDAFDRGERTDETADGLEEGDPEGVSDSTTQQEPASLGEETPPASKIEEAWPYGESEIDPERPRSRDITTKELGKRGEDAAVNYLVRRGFQILERNWTCRFGEADIIALDEDGVVCFIEVKTRRSVEAGLPEEAITKEKRRRYEKLALTYLMEANWNDDVDLRFDAIGICVTGDFQAILKYHRGCFDGFC